MVNLRCLAFKVRSRHFDIKSTGLRGLDSKNFETISSFFFVSRSYERAPFDQNLYTVLCATSKPAFWRPLKWVRGHGSGLDSRPQPRECCWAAALNQYSMDCLDMHMFNSVKTKQPHKLFKLWMHVSSISSSLFNVVMFSQRLGLWLSWSTEGGDEDLRVWSRGGSKEHRRNEGFAAVDGKPMSKGWSYKISTDV